MLDQISFYPGILIHCMGQLSVLCDKSIQSVNRGAFDMWIVKLMVWPFSSIRPYGFAWVGVTWLLEQVIRLPLSLLGSVVHSFRISKHEIEMCFSWRDSNPGPIWHLLTYTISAVHFMLQKCRWSELLSLNSPCKPTYLCQNIQTVLVPLLYKSSLNN